MKIKNLLLIISVSQYFFLSAALLISFKSFATDCPSDGIRSSTTCSGDISTTGGDAFGIFLDNDSSNNSANTVKMTGNITTRDRKRVVLGKCVGIGGRRNKKKNMAGGGAHWGPCGGARWGLGGAVAGKPPKKFGANISNQLLRNVYGKFRKS